MDVSSYPVGYPSWTSYGCLQDILNYVPLLWTSNLDIHGRRKTDVYQSAKNQNLTSSGIDATIVLTSVRKRVYLPSPASTQCPQDVIWIAPFDFPTNFASNGIHRNWLRLLFAISEKWKPQNLAWLSRGLVVKLMQTRIFISKLCIISYRFRTSETKEPNTISNQHYQVI